MSFRFADATFVEIAARILPELATYQYATYEEFHVAVKEVFNAMSDDAGLTGEEFLEKLWVGTDRTKVPAYIPPPEVSFWQPLYLSVRRVGTIDLPGMEVCSLCLGTKIEPKTEGTQCSNCNGLGRQMTMETRRAMSR